MRQKVLFKSLNRRQVLNVRAYIIQRLEKIKKRVYYYFDWKSFSLGVSFCRTTGLTGWKYMLSFDLGFFSFWVYFMEIKNYKNVQ
jgi:hypothetical protein